MLKIWSLVLALLSCQILTAQSKTFDTSVKVMSKLLNESTAQGLSMLDLYSLTIIESLVKNLLDYVQAVRKEKEGPIYSTSNGEPEDSKSGEEKNELLSQVSDLLFHGLHHIVDNMEDKLIAKQ